MQMYKIELVQVRKMTIYCSADNQEGAEEWFKEHYDNIFDHLNNEYGDNVYCFTAYAFSEDKSAETLFDMLHGEQPEKQMEAVYKVLKQETKEESDDGTPN